MERIPILKMGEYLLVSIQVDMHDRLALQLQDDLTSRIAATGARGVLIDISALETKGSPVPVADNITAVTTVGAVVALSANGLLAYQPRSSTALGQAPVVWLDRSGATMPLRAAPAAWARLR